MSEAEKIADKKEKAIAYYSEVPVYRYTAMFVGIDEDTLLLWRKKDSEFSEALDRARANWVKKQLPKAQVNFALERLEREIFRPPKQEVEHGIDAVSILLEKYGIIEGQPDDRKDDGAISSTSQSNS